MEPNSVKRTHFAVVCVLAVSVFVFVFWTNYQPELRRNLLTTELNVVNGSFEVFTQCLIDIDRALKKTSLEWFIAFGNALVYHRSKSFVSEDIDIGIFYEDFASKNLSASMFVSTLRNFSFVPLIDYGNLSDGQEWNFQCPFSSVHLGVFLFYRLEEEKHEKPSFWVASYNGRCSQMKRKKCRWKFSNFVPETIFIEENQFRIAPKKFLVEKYGELWTVPKKYSYFESIYLAKNLIEETDGQ